MWIISVCVQQVYWLDRSPGVGLLGQSINAFIIWRINSQIQYLESVLKSCYSFQLKKKWWDLCNWVILACLVCVFTLKRLKETYFQIQLQKYMDFYGWFFYIFPCPYFCFCKIIIVLNTSLLKACITRWLWTPTASEPGCESELHSSVTLGNSTQTLCDLYPQW